MAALLSMVQTLFSTYCVGIRLFEQARYHCRLDESHCIAFLAYAVSRESLQRMALCVVQVNDIICLRTGSSGLFAVELTRAFHRECR
jgi:hypothetical protein